MTDASSSSVLGSGCRFCKLTHCSWSMKRDFALVFFRLTLGGMMLVHGYPKLLMLLEAKGAAWMNPLGLGASFSLFLCVVAEFFCSIAIMLGLCTRFAALILAINCWVIVFVVQIHAGWSNMELPTLYFICYMSLIGLGAGRFSVDHWLISTCLKKDHLRAFS